MTKSLLLPLLLLALAPGLSAQYHFGSLQKVTIDQLKTGDAKVDRMIAEFLNNSPFDVSYNGVWDGDLFRLDGGVHEVSQDWVISVGFDANSRQRPHQFFFKLDIDNIRAGEYYLKVKWKITEKDTATTAAGNVIIGRVRKAVPGRLIAPIRNITAPSPGEPPKIEFRLSALQGSGGGWHRLDFPATAVFTDSNGNYHVVAYTVPVYIWLGADERMPN